MNLSALTYRQLFDLGVKLESDVAREMRTGAPCDLEAFIRVGKTITKKYRRMQRDRLDWNKPESD